MRWHQSGFVKLALDSTRLKTKMMQFGDLVFDFERSPFRGGPKNFLGIEKKLPVSCSLLTLELSKY